MLRKVVLASILWLLSMVAWADPIWIDVRTPHEFAQGHIPQAVLVPYDQIAQRIEQLVPDKNTDIRLYCRSGRRAGVALQTLQRLGYTRVVNEGGLQDVVTKYGFEVVK